MYIKRKPGKKSIAFTAIREGTVFINGDETYIKGSNGAATNLESGQVVYPANDVNGNWGICYIYPRASLSLD